MSSVTEKIIDRLRDKLTKKSKECTQEPTDIIKPAEMAIILGKLQATWGDSEADRDTLHHFIDEWVQSHK